MDDLLSPSEIRVLGCLIEKEFTTPEYYPLTLNALTNACNQKNNRDPVVAFEEGQVLRALEGLREKKLVSMVTGAGIRVPKYRHNFETAFNVTKPQEALLCVLMLRGPQTAGELRGRSAPLQKFNDLNEVEQSLEALNTPADGRPLAKKVQRSPGQKEARYAHLLGGEPQVQEGAPGARSEQETPRVQADNERILKLEEELARVRADIEELKQVVLDFKKQFD